MKTGKVVSVSASAKHSFSKQCVEEIELIPGEGVKGDAHRGRTVKHRSRVKANPSQPNLRQVHLLHQELIDELRLKGFAVDPGSLGENITTSGIQLLDLPEGTILRIGNAAKLSITGLRNPCAQLDDFQQGLLAAVLGKDEHGNLIRRAGVMSIVISGGIIRPDDPVEIILPKPPFSPLKRV